MKQNIYDDPDFFKGYVALRDDPAHGFNDALEKPAFRALLPDLKGVKMLDIGCGFGVDCQWYVEQGAEKVLGIDISEKMIALARERNSHEQIDYQVIAAEDLDTCSLEFDLVVSSLGFHYVEDFEGLIGNISQILKPGGQLVFSQEHPLTTCVRMENSWVKDELGKKIAWMLEDYGIEGKRSHRWMDKEVVIYHRNFSTLINGLLRHGFEITGVRESNADEAVIKAFPRLYSARIISNFLVVSARRK